MQTNNAAVAEWLEPPTTAYMLDFVRPDLLMLRIIARGLVLWDSISPMEDWVEDQVPDTIRPYCFVKPTEANVDYEAMNQAYCNIVAGACFALGLRFAGSGNEIAKETVLYYANRLASPPRRLPELAGAATLETCSCVCLLAAGCIMAGRGDLEVMRLCRRLRARTAASRGPAPSRPKAHAPLTHGAQMAVHMTLGLLFLGGGRATLASTPEAVAALLIAFFPKFPTHTEDNRYHLQAFRHLYVLAVENRLVLPRDIDSGNLCYAFIQVIDVDNYLREYKAPCIIPELNQLKVVKIDDTRYWPILFERDRNWDQLKTFLEYTWCVDIKQRAGCLPYSKDPEGFTTMLGHTLTLDQTNIWSAKPDNIDLFSSDRQVRGFIRHYLAQDDAEVGTNICGDCLVLKKKRGGKEMNRTCVCRKYSKEEQEFIQSLNVVTYECVVKDVLRALPIWTSFLKIIKLMRTEPSSYHMWQIKLLLAQVESLSRRSSDEMDVDDNENEPLISTEFTLAVKQKIALVFDKWELKIVPFLRKYLGMPSSRSINSCHDDIKRILASFLVYHELRRNLLGDSGFDTSELGLVMCEKASLSGVAASKVLELVR